LSRDALIVFVKAPRPGATKTRLARHIGDHAAAAVYRAVAGDSARRLAPRSFEYERLFFYAPADARAEVESWLCGETCLPQVEGDLGERMAAAFEATFGRGAPRAAIIGSDVPGLSGGAVREAFDALCQHDLVLGPARDGGYYLLALRRPWPALFAGLAWSTPSVLAATLERAQALGLTVHLLQPLTDIDTLEDLRLEWPAVAALLDGSTRAAIEAVLRRG
jgi:rSAM/selenodomain-associated transferase 1